jgi:hypothetical protein
MSHSAYRMAALLAIALGTSVPASAQAPIPPAGGVLRGDSVRIQILRSDPVDASVVGWRADTLVMRVQGQDELWHLAAREIGVLQRYQAIPPQDAFRSGLMLGAATGVFAGAAVGILLYASGVTKDEDGPPAEQLVHSALKFSGLFTVGGALVGGIVGGRNPGWGWVGVKLRTR